MKSMYRRVASPDSREIRDVWDLIRARAGQWRHRCQAVSSSIWQRRQDGDVERLVLNKW